MSATFFQLPRNKNNAEDGRLRMMESPLDLSLIVTDYKAITIHEIARSSESKTNDVC